MFMIPIRVQDNTGTLTLTMFEREGKKVNVLKGLKLAFKISIKNFNVSKKNNQYGIARISDDESLIQQLENKLTESQYIILLFIFCIIQLSNSQSLDFGSADLQYQQTRNLKDAIFGTDDNITPSTIDKRDNKSNEEFDHNTELNYHLSSSKAPKISPDGPGKQLLKFIWKRKGLFWKPREVGYAIDRIHSVSPKLGEAYFLRILLNKVKGPKSFDEIHTVNGELCSFKDACYNLGLLDDDKEFIDAIKEASLYGSDCLAKHLGIPVRWNSLPATTEIKSLQVI
uniref:Replication factor A C-terminal domain-containing protein n=1 Tax=Lactuca sativa TaxID=4236 RepID=A0A9R1UR23_LACSA|nr:hypothetical protein LSAT_V11C800392480 [Lactuca sativa]